MWNDVYAIGFARSFAIAAIALAAAYPVRQLLLTLQPGWPRRLAWAMLLVPLLTPALLIGYAYWDDTIMLARHARLKEALYVAIMAARLTAITTAALYFAPPPPVSPHATWCARLANAGAMFRCGVWLRGPATNAAVAFAAAFLLAFAEFEIASLLNVRAWTVWLFDAQAGGLVLGESLRRSLVPLAIELTVLAPVLALVLRRRQLPAPAALGPRRAVWRTRVLAWAYLCAGVMVVTVLPLFDVLRQSPQVNFMVQREIMASVVMALAAAGVVTALARLLAEGKQHLHPAALATLVLLCLPGLLGSLLLSMFVLTLFANAGPLRDGPLPLLLALVLLLLPIGLLLHALLRGLSHNAATHAARLLARHPAPGPRRASRNILWRMKNRAGAYVFFLVFLWAYFDVCTGVLLRPRAMTLAPDLLYNQMHYGQNAALAGTLLIVVAVPVVLWCFVVLGWSGLRLWTTHE